MLNDFQGLGYDVLSIVGGECRWPCLVVQCTVLSDCCRLVVQHISVEELASLDGAVLSRMCLVVGGCMMLGLSILSD